MSREQSMEALARGTEIRKARAEYKAHLRRGEMTLGVAMGLPYTQTMLLRKLLLAVPGIGTSKAHKIMAELMIGPNAKVGDISEVRRRQLEELVG